MFEILTVLKASDGQMFDSIENARKHELALLFPEDVDVPQTILNHWDRILEIMTAKPGAKPRKPRKPRKDKGQKRVGKPSGAIVDGPTGPPESTLTPGATVTGSGKYKGK